MNGNFPVPYEPGNLTAIGHDKDGSVLASFTRLTPAAGGVASLKLSIDAPSPLTGTGSGMHLMDQVVSPCETTHISRSCVTARTDISCEVARHIFLSVSI